MISIGFQTLSGALKIGIGAGQRRSRGGNFVLALGPAFHCLRPASRQLVGLDDMKRSQGRSQLLLHLLEALGLLGLALELAKRTVDLVNDVIQTNQILPCMLQLEFGLMSAHLVARDARRLLEQNPSVGRPGRQHLPHPALLDDRVVPGSQPNRQQFVDNILETDNLAV